MNKKVLLTLAVAGSVVAVFAAKKDPAVMRVAGKDVPRSEFEYLYHKNANQQLQPQTIEEYAEMFKLYKQKVADAKAEGLDTTASFRNEFGGYLVELRAPYLVDSTYVRQLMREAYDRMGQEVEINHIMLMKPRGPQTGPDLYSKADSLRNELLAGADFATMAEQYSDDKTSAVRGGRMGWFTSLMLPYEFETAAYTTPEGQISDIVETDFGYHILKGGAKRPARGEVLVEHILRLVPDTASAAGDNAVKAQMDSLYNVVRKDPAAFEDIATKYSDDKGSARQGGKLNWFGVGRMVPEFDSVAFALPVGEISEPFRTAYGYHIIKKLNARGIPSYEDALPMLTQAMNNRSDTRGRWRARQFTEKLRKKYGYKCDKGIRKQMEEYVKVHGLRTDFNDYFEPMAGKFFMSIDGKKYTVGDFLEHLTHFRNVGYPSTGVQDLQSRIENFEQRECYGHFIDLLPQENADYRNLENEYRDGMLLFEVSNRKVWDKAAKDTEGLKAFFEKNRADYVWQSPRVKGVLVQAVDDSVANRVKAVLDTMPVNEAIPAIRKEYAGKAKVDRILMSKGDNQLVDALVFGGAPVQNSDSKYPVYFLQSFKLIEAPEEVDDVKAQVTADYQNALEAAWIEELQAKYPVEIFEKELKKVK